MFNLEKEENLIQVEQFLEGDDLPLSQESGASAYSLPLSDMEIDLPVRSKPPIPPKKKLEDCNPNYQRCKTNDLYQHCIEKSKEYEIDPIKMFCKMAARYAHQNQRELEETFRNIADGKWKVPREMSMDEAVFLKSCWIKTQIAWKNYRKFMRGYVTLPTDEEISKYTEDLTPDFIPFKNGWRFPFEKTVEKALQSLPEEVIDSLFNMK